jgi:hypothetical protein
MENEFINYEQALALKELGFDEPCFAVYIDKTLIIEDDWLYSTNQDTFIESNNITAPLYQQAFRWFRDEHNISVNVYLNENGWLYKIYDNEDGNYDVLCTSFREDGNYDGVFTSFREAEIACLKYLIGFVDFCSYIVETN